MDSLGAVHVASTLDSVAFGQVSVLWFCLASHHSLNAQFIPLMICNTVLIWGLASSPVHGWTLEKGNLAVVRECS